MVDVTSSRPGTAPVRSLRLATDDHGSTLVWDGLRISFIPHDEPPRDVDAVVLEEDTHLLLGTDVVAAPVGESYAQLGAAAMRVASLAPGSVARRGSQPTRLLAVVHDLDRNPSWREAWICRALANALALCDAQGFSRVALPLLGTAHGSMDVRRAVHLTLRALARRRGTTVRRVLLRLDEAQRRIASRALAARIAK